MAFICVAVISISLVFRCLFLAVNSLFSPFWTAKTVPSSKCDDAPITSYFVHIYEYTKWMRFYLNMCFCAHRHTQERTNGRTHARTHAHKSTHSHFGSCATILYALYSVTESMCSIKHFDKTYIFFNVYVISSRSWSIVFVIYANCAQQTNVVVVALLLVDQAFQIRIERHIHGQKCFPNFLFEFFVSSTFSSFGFAHHSSTLYTTAQHSIPLWNLFVGVCVCVCVFCLLFCCRRRCRRGRRRRCC